MLFRFVDRNAVRNFFGVHLIKLAKENEKIVILSTYMFSVQDSLKLDLTNIAFLPLVYEANTGF